MMSFFQSLLAFMSGAILFTVGFNAAGQSLVLRDSVQQDESRRKALDYYLRGYSLQASGERHAEAVIEFQHSLLYDSSAGTMVAMARSYAELRKFDLALATIRVAFQKDSVLADAWEFYAELLVSLGRYDEALDAYSKIRTMNPTRRQMLTLARLYEYRNAATAIELYEQILETGSEPLAMQRLAELYERTKQFDKRAAILERLIRQQTDDGHFTIGLIDSYIRGRNYVALQHLLANLPPTEISLRMREDIWMRALVSLLSDTTSALSSKTAESIIDVALRQYERMPRLLTLAGSLALNMSLDEHADKCFSAAFRNSDSPDPFIYVALQRIEKGQPDMAADVLDKGLVLYPSNATLWVLRGSLLIQNSKWIDAHAALVRAASLDPQLPDAWIYLAAAYEALDSLSKSYDAYNRVLLLDSKNYLAMNNFAYTLAISGDSLQRARNLSWMAVQHSPSNPAFLDTYAWILFKLGDLEKARQYQEKAVAYGGAAIHYEHLGDIFDALGLLDEAVRAWRKSLELDPENEDVKQKLIRYR